MNHKLAFAIFNVVGFQIVWFACVAGAGRGLLWPGLLACALFAGIVLAWGGKRREDLRALACLLPLGIAIDSIFAASGWLAYALPWPWVHAAPIWIAALWVGFILTLNHSLSFLRGKPFLALLFGLLGGPAAYAASANVFGAVEFGVEPMLALAAVALCWALVTPLAFVLIRVTAPPPSKAIPA